jgi:hypothetical protein
MTKRPANRMAWGLAAVLAVVLLGGMGLLMSLPADAHLGIAIA